MDEEIAKKKMAEGWDLMFNAPAPGPYERPLLRSTFQKYSIPLGFFAAGVSEEEAKKPQDRQRYNPRQAMHRWLAAGGNQKAGAVVTNYCKNMSTAIKKGQGLFLFGPNGTGKTGLTAIVAASFLQANEPFPGRDYQDPEGSDMPDRFKVQYIKTSEIEALGKMSRNFGDYYDKREALVNMGMLVIDDLASSILSADHQTAQDFLDIIKERLGNNRITIFNTNLTKLELKTLGADTLLDAVTEKCFALDVPDRIRKPNTQKDGKYPWE